MKEKLRKAIVLHISLARWENWEYEESLIESFRVEKHNISHKNEVTFFSGGVKFQRTSNRKIFRKQQGLYPISLTVDSQQLWDPEELDGFTVLRERGCQLVNIVKCSRTSIHKIQTSLDLRKIIWEEFFFTVLVKE